MDGQGTGGDRGHVGHGKDGRDGGGVCHRWKPAQQQPRFWWPSLSNYGTCATSEPPPHAMVHHNMVDARVGCAHHAP